MAGNRPIDSAILHEFLPETHQSLLTVRSIEWALAQVFATLIARPPLSSLTCQETQKTCKWEENAGWRWFVITMGGVTLIIFFVRFIQFQIYESPKELMDRGEDEEAVEVVHEVAKYDGTYTNLTVEDLKRCEAAGGTCQTKRCHRSAKA